MSAQPYPDGTLDPALCVAANQGTTTENDIISLDPR